MLGVAIPFVLLNTALPRVKTVTAAITLNLVPVFAVGSSVALLGEHLMITAAAGGLLVLGGLLQLSRQTEPISATSTY